MRGRIRTVKPEVHTDEELWDAELQTGMPLFRLFVGLWNYADREGRFPWRPRALRALILPYWGGDIDGAMAALLAAGFIVRYAVEGREYGVVRTFSKHQIVNNREDPSALPGPPDPEILTVHKTGQVDACPTRAPRVPDASSTGGAHVAELEKARAARVGHAGKVERKGTEREGNGTLAPLDARVCDARMREGPTAGQVQTRFRALFEARFGSAPYLGGGEVIATFPDRLRDTAKLKCIDPLELLEQTFAAWAQKPLDELAQNAPYAAFAARFGSLSKPNGSNGSTSELDDLHAAQNAALEARDMARYESLVAEERRRKPKEPKS